MGALAVSVLRSMVVQAVAGQGVARGRRVLADAGRGGDEDGAKWQDADAASDYSPRQRVPPLNTVVGGGPGAISLRDVTRTHKGGSCTMRGIAFGFAMVMAAGMLAGCENHEARINAATQNAEAAASRAEAAARRVEAAAARADAAASRAEAVLQKIEESREQRPARHTRHTRHHRK